ncbi:MAG: antibiotic biosynthesis monooxygenase family protein [Thermoplasmatota archaeon]
MAYGLVVTFRSRPGARDELAAHLLGAAGYLEGAEGLVSWLVHEVAGERDRLMVTEVWSSRAAHDACLTLDAVKAALASADALLLEPPKRVETRPLGGRP